MVYNGKPLLKWMIWGVKNIPNFWADTQKSPHWGWSIGVPSGSVSITCCVLPAWRPFTRDRADRILHDTCKMRGTWWSHVAIPWVVPPPRIPVTTRIITYIFRLGDPDLNLHLPRLHPGRGGQPNLYLSIPIFAVTTSVRWARISEVMSPVDWFDLTRFFPVKCMEMYQYQVQRIASCLRYASVILLLAPSGKDFLKNMFWINLLLSYYIMCMWWMLQDWRWTC